MSSKRLPSHRFCLHWPIVFRSILWGISVSLCAFTGACHSAGEVGRDERSLPFSLNEFLQENGIDDKSHEIRFQILDQQGHPVPFGLLRLEWPENGARMSFQTDGEGGLSMHFDEDMRQSQVMVSADIKPEGQVLLKEASYDQSSQPLLQGRIRAAW